MEGSNNTILLVLVIASVIQASLLMYRVTQLEDALTDSISKLEFKIACERARR